MPLREDDPELLAALVGRLEKTVEAGFEDMRREFRNVNVRLATLEEWKSGVIAVDEERRKVVQDAVRERAYVHDARVMTQADVIKVVLVALGVLAAVLGVVAGILSVIG